MNIVFIEAQKADTAESHFLRAVISRFFPGKDVGFIYMDGIDNLFNETILNQMSQAIENGDDILVMADADTVAKGYGYARRKADIEKGIKGSGISFPFFLYPDNCSDGDVETLMEKTARRDLHKTFFDCFDDYERCVLGKKDLAGQPIYSVPNLKGKLHTYISSQRLSNKQRKRLGSGDWLFDDGNYWNLADKSLQPLKDFLSNNLK